jgi:triosephosphate isomerase
MIAANWKMHKLIAEAAVLVEALKSKPRARAEIVVAPPFTALSTVNGLLKGTDIRLAAQDVYWEAQGAFTGEISPLMLKDAGCSHVIVGHSERRRLFGDDDAGVNRKIKSARAHGLNVIFCVGETLQQRESGKTRDVVLAQLDGGLEDVTDDTLAGVVIAYEPVWAIGTGRNATPEQASEVHGLIRGHVAGRRGSVAETLRILYGGSVTSANSRSLLTQPDIDGALVGGASLDADTFYAIIDSLN